MYALFIDFKAAFDSVNREKMWEYLRRKGVDAYLVTKMEEIYEETVSKVRVNGIESENFYTNRGVRQGCPLRPGLFAAYLGDIEFPYAVRILTSNIVYKLEYLLSSFGTFPGIPPPLSFQQHKRRRINGTDIAVFNSLVFPL